MKNPPCISCSARSVCYAIPSLAVTNITAKPIGVRAPLRPRTLYFCQECLDIFSARLVEFCEFPAELEEKPH